ncbi:MAG: 30S ribosomal protein S8 [Acidiferrobacteraceae bacterium]|nr:30S ribosomal protein S8 [Acidiferrobacteraceae bacterium]
MSMSDPIADMLTRIRNGHAASSTSVSMPSSRIKEAIGRVLEDEGFIDSCVVSEVDSKKTLTINLRYYEEQPVISNLQRVSRPGKRVYRRRDEIPIINNGLGVLVVSTSRGIMTGRQAQAAGIGGELLCAVS